MISESPRDFAFWNQAEILKHGFSFRYPEIMGHWKTLPCERLPLNIMVLLFRKAETECRAYFQFTLYPNPAAVALDDVLYDGKAKAGAPQLSGAILVHAVEALKYAVQVLSRYTDSCVCNGDVHFISRILYRDRDGSPFRCIFDRIVQEVHKGLADLIPIGPYHGLFGHRLRFDVQVLCLRKGFHDQHSTIHNLAQIHLILENGRALGFKPCQGKKVLQQR